MSANQTQSIVYGRLTSTYTQAYHILYPWNHVLAFATRHLTHIQTHKQPANRLEDQPSKPPGIPLTHHPHRLTNPLSTFSAKLTSPPVTSLTNSSGGSNSMT